MSDLLKLLEFVFSGFWTWLGFLILVSVVINVPLSILAKMFRARSGSIKASKDAVEVNVEKP